MFVEILKSFKMKKSFLLFLSLFILLTAFTCENEPLEGEYETLDFSNTGSNTPGGNSGGESSSNSEDLIGTWDLVSLDLDMTSSFDPGTGMMVTGLNVESTEVDYQVTFTETNFNTEGSYSYTTQIETAGMVINDSYTMQNVTGTGQYTTNGNQITTQGSFFQFIFEGMDDSLFDDEQTATYEISDNGQTLTFLQDETTVNTDSGYEVVVDVLSTSVWQKVD